MGTNLLGSAGPALNLAIQKAQDLGDDIKKILKIDAERWSYGTGANQANIVYAETHTLADGANSTLDLYASGSLVDIFGAALTLSALKILYIKNNSSDATLKVGGGASNDLDIFADTSDKLLIKPGGTFIWVCPTAAGLDITTNKNLKLEHDGTGSSTMDVDVIAIGED